MNASVLSEPGFYIMAILAIGVLTFNHKLRQPLPDEAGAVKALVEREGLTFVGYTANSSPWRNWMRGRLLTSNVARNLFVSAVDRNGGRLVVEMIVDRWSSDGQPKIVSIAKETK